MALLRQRSNKRQGAGRLRSYTVLRCPCNGHQVSWCRQLCHPVEGMGLCGRLAPHGMVGRTQAAIAAYNARATRSGGSSV